MKTIRNAALNLTVLAAGSALAAIAFAAFSWAGAPVVATVVAVLVVGSTVKTLVS